MKKVWLLAVVSALVLALIAASFFSRDSSPEDSTVSGEVGSPSALQPQMRALEPSDNTGSSAAAVTEARSTSDLVFSEARDCVMASRSVRMIEPQLEACQRNTAVADPVKDADFLRSCREREAKLRPMLEAAKEASTSCGVISSPEAVFYQATKEAAEQGNLDAQLCYLRGLFEFGTPLSEADRSEYTEHARTYIESGLQRGDWRIIELLRLSDRPRASGLTLPSRVLGADRPSVLQANRLLKLSASDKKYAASLDVMPAGRGPEPTPHDLAQAQQWANTTYNLYFKRSPRLPERPEVCENTFGGL